MAVETIFVDFFHVVGIIVNHEVVIYTLSEVSIRWIMETTSYEGKLWKNLWKKEISLTIRRLTTLGSFKV